MASPREIEVTVSSAKDLKNVNWRYGPIRPYVVLWVDPKYKRSSKVDEEGDTSPIWDETLLIPLPPASLDDDTTLFIDVVHAGSEDDTNPLIGSAKIKLRDVLHDAGFGVSHQKTLKLKRPSGRPHGKLEVAVFIREPRYQASDPYRASPYGVPPPASRDYTATPPAYGYPYQYAQPPLQQSPYYENNAYSYNAQPAYGEKSGGYYGYGQEEKKKSKFGGMGTGLAVGAVAGVLGGLALAEGVDALEDHFEDKVADKVEDDIEYDDGGDDF